MKSLQSLIDIEQWNGVPHGSLIAWCPGVQNVFYVGKKENGVERFTRHVKVWRVYSGVGVSSLDAFNWIARNMHRHISLQLHEGKPSMFAMAGSVHRLLIADTDEQPMGLAHLVTLAKAIIEDVESAS